MWEGFVAEGLRRSWEMALRRLNPKMIVNIHDIVERNLSKKITRLEASLADRVKEEVRKEF